MKDFIKEHNIVILNVKKVPGNPNMPDFNADHYFVTLSRLDANSGRKNWSLYYSKGVGHKGKRPTVEEILECLQSEASLVDGMSFDDFCYDLGYDTDSRKALETYLICQKQQDEIKAWLGASYQAFIECELE